MCNLNKRFVVLPTAAALVVVSQVNISGNWMWLNALKKGSRRCGIQRRDPFNLANPLVYCDGNYRMPGGAINLQQKLSGPSRHAALLAGRILLYLPGASPQAISFLRKSENDTPVLCE